MSIAIEVERETGIAIASCSGALTLDQAKEGASALWGNPEWPGKVVVWDFRSAGFDLSSSEIREIAGFILRHQRTPPPSKVAFVTQRDVDFGLARMFEVFREDPVTAFRVFHGSEEAMSWVRSSEPDAV